MLIYLLRHGETEWNVQRRYQGLTNLPLSEAGRANLGRANFAPQRVWVSPLRRAVETAAILFPGVDQTVIYDFRELDFGVFEGRTAEEMAEDPSYQAWVESGGSGRCPGGEDWAGFSARTCAAFSRLMDSAPDPLVVIAHGGTQMAVLERYGRPARPRWEWLGKNGGGFLLEAKDWRREQTLTLVKTVYWG